MQNCWAAVSKHSPCLLGSVPSEAPVPLFPSTKVRIASWKWFSFRILKILLSLYPDSQEELDPEFQFSQKTLFWFLGLLCGPSLFLGRLFGYLQPSTPQGCSVGRLSFIVLETRRLLQCGGWCPSVLRQLLDYGFIIFFPSIFCHLK